ncbi:hypothetical protein RUMOBE_01207 [Blautia obeum ATCC 29174]|jgi:hypothetical protein|uniref:Uncharacterized protein n=1 Tax=Blautia obeum ATCC 29174 TaxID=411459 RepID=A5ZQD7_9FIRM|nr:hypothetical protein RUMOBE_01207 [Blautia obeum ATCC 29174]
MITYQSAKSKHLFECEIKIPAGKFLSRDKIKHMERMSISFKE